MLALLCHDVEHDFGDLGLVAASLLFDLGKGGGIDVEGLDVDQDFVVVDLVHIVVYLVGGLGEHAFGLEHAVRTVFVAFLLHGMFRLVFILVES